MRGGKPQNPYREQNKASANIGPYPKGPVGQGASIVGNAQQARGFAATKQERNQKNLM